MSSGPSAWILQASCAALSLAAAGALDLHQYPYPGDLSGDPGLHPYPYLGDLSGGPDLRGYLALGDRSRGAEIEAKSAGGAAGWSFDPPLVASPASLGLAGQAHRTDEDHSETLADIQPIKAMATRYGKNAASQRAYLNLLVPDMLSQLKDGSVIFDLGSSDGMNTVEAIQSMEAKTKNFSLGFVDLPANSWGELKTGLGPIVPKIQPDSGYVMAPQSGLPSDGTGPAAVLVAGSFYDRVAPDNTVDVAICCTAVHYLSEGLKVKPMVQARQNWLGFLQWRAKELRPGGVLLITGTAKRKDAQPTRTYHATNQVLGKSIYDAMRMGMISKSAFRHWLFPSYSRSEAEYRRPFENNEVPGLVLEKLEMVALPSPYWGMANGNATEFANLYVPSVVAWVGPYITGTLGDRVLDLYKQNLWREIQQRPESFVADFLQAVMRIRKL
mmetsp:Transcript_8388/g.23634  ORF Transcript_8388/g.23634 Transcript_8388/m.23634 type:complete len:442 (-) Transcript_8388:141-1466(-)